VTSRCGPKVANRQGIAWRQGPSNCLSAEVMFQVAKVIQTSEQIPVRVNFNHAE